MSQAEDSHSSKQDYQDDYVIEAQNVVKSYGEVQALRDASLEVRDGEILALVGDNGAGKSTFMNILTGVISPTGGTIRMRTNGSLKDVTEDEPEVLETVFQDLQLSMKHDVASNVFMAQEPLQDDLKGRLLRRVDRETMEQEAMAALEEIGIPIDPNATVRELSGGQQQAVAVARALVSDPEIVILDEPTAEVSVEGTEKILNLMERLNDEGRTIIFVTHNLEEVFEVADRVAVLRNGEIVDVLEVTDSLARQDLVGLMTGGIEIHDD